MKIFLRIVSLLLCMGIYLSCASVPVSAIVVNQVPSTIKDIKQEKSNWCWAACSEIVGKSVYPSSSVSQSQIVNKLKGSIGNYLGSINDIMAGCEYAGNYKKRFTYGDSCYNELLDFSQVGTRIGNGIGVIAAVYVTNNLQHDVVIAATTFYDGDGGTTYSIGYIDPIDGKRYYCSFDDFCSGNKEGGARYGRVRVMIYSV